MGCGRIAAIVFPSRTSRGGGAIVCASWCKSTARSTPGLRTADRHARCWLSSKMRRAVDAPAVRRLGIGIRLVSDDPRPSGGARQSRSRSTSTGTASFGRTARTLFLGLLEPRCCAYRLPQGVGQLSLRYSDRDLAEFGVTDITGQPAAPSASPVPRSSSDVDQGGDSLLYQSRQLLSMW